MTKKEKEVFAAAIIEKTGVEVDKKQLVKIIEASFALIAEDIKAGNKVALDGIGILEQVDKPARATRNPRTGEKGMSKPCKAAKFKMAKALKDSLNA